MPGVKLIPFLLLLFLNCTFAIADEKYGYDGDYPIKVGGIDWSLGEIAAVFAGHNDYDYLRALRGPNGEQVQFERIGSCCPYEIPEGTVILDKWKLSYDGLEEPVEIYTSIYEFETPRAPKGFQLDADFEASLNKSLNADASDAGAG